VEQWCRRRWWLDWRSPAQCATPTRFRHRTRPKARTLRFIGARWTWRCRDRGGLRFGGRPACAVRHWPGLGREMNVSGLRGFALHPEIRERKYPGGMKSRMPRLEETAKIHPDPPRHFSPDAHEWPLVPGRRSFAKLARFAKPFSVNSICRAGHPGRGPGGRVGPVEAFRGRPAPSRRLRIADAPGFCARRNMAWAGVTIRNAKTRSIGKAVLRSARRFSRRQAAPPRF